ncbi:DUF1802 family protein [soil metagenome]
MNVHPGSPGAPSGAAPVPRNRSALKEWASIEQALDAGTVLLLRKGGIYEQREGFRVEHREFWIFPTFFHQNAEEISPAFAWTLDAARALHPGVDSVRIATYAVVTDVLRIERLEAVETLQGLHPLRAETVASRFHYKQRPYLHALVLRTYRLPEPRLIPNTLDHEGCISWVELDEEVPTHGAAPVLDDAEFSARRAEILQRPGGEGVIRL